MTDQQWLLLGVLALSLGLDLFSVAGITGLLNINHARLVSMQGGQADRIKPTLRLAETLVSSRANASVQLAAGVLRFLIAGLALVILQAWLFTGSSTWIVGIKIAGVFVAAGLVLAWLEWITSQNALRRPETWALRCTTLIRVWMVIFYPLAALGNLIYSGSIDINAGSVTEDELKSLVDAGQQNGVLEQEERKMIYSIFQLGDTLAREIMIPRIDIMALDVQTPYDQAVDNLLQSGYSRVPVYEESIDTVLGVLYTKDLLRVFRQNDQVKGLRDLLRPAHFIPEAKKVDELLAEMQSQRVHMAVVVDEYGGVAGLVTLEDIVEEIVGEIQDEFDQAEELPYQEVSKGEYIFQGRIGLDDFNEIMGSRLPSDEAETLGGFIYNRVGRVPVNGESIQVDNLMLTVTQIIGRRIRKVRAQWIPVTPEGREEKLMLTDEERSLLIQSANEIRQWAYAPYSHYPVGAALLAASGRVYTGVNIENAAYPSGTCAERVAVFKAVSDGERQFTAIAVVTNNGGSPCGTCRQVLAEFGLETIVIIADQNGKIVQETTVANLLPGSFGPQDLIKSG